jgi:hypothetical protein
MADALREAGWPMHTTEGGAAPVPAPRAAPRAYHHFQPGALHNERAWRERVARPLEFLFGPAQ